MATPTHASTSSKLSAPVGRSLWLLALERFSHNRLALMGVGLALVIVLSAILAPTLAPYDPLARNFAERLAPPSGRHWLGTDTLGRDVMSRLLYGGRVSLYVGLASVALSMVIGVPLGLASGYFGGVADSALMRLVDLILAFPGILFAIWLVAMLGPGVSQVVLANALFSLPSFARIVRGSVLSIKEDDFVLAARSIGASDARIMIAHIMPNVLASIVILGSLSIASAILTGASLSFLGLGAQPPTPEWGAMLADGRPYLRDAWWLALFPGMALTLIVLASNIVGDGLRDAFDPRMTTTRGPGT